MKKLSFVLLLTIILSACGTDNIEKSSLDFEVSCNSMETSTEKELDEMVSLLNEDNIEPLKDKLNEKVLVSKERLEEELITAAHHTCIDMDNWNDNRNIKLYFSMLEYFHALMEMENEESLKIGKLELGQSNTSREYGINVELENGHQADSLYIDSFAISSDILEEFNKGPVIESNAMAYAYIFKIDFIDRLFSGLENPLNAAFYDIPSSLEDKDFLRWEIDIREALLASDYWHLEAIISDGTMKEQAVLSSEENWREIKIYPTERTYEQIERLEKVHSINPDIPYPKEALEKEEWYEATDYMLSNGGIIDDIDPDLYFYIDAGQTNDRKVEDIANGK